MFDSGDGLLLLWDEEGEGPWVGMVVVPAGGEAEVVELGLGPCVDADMESSLPRRWRWASCSAVRW